MTFDALLNQPQRTSSYDKMLEPMRAAEAKANREVPDFTERARAFILSYLTEHRQAPGEQITDACVAAGIRPAELRAFGGVYQGLARKNLIRTVAFCARMKGNGTSGGRVWALVQ